MSRSVVTLGLLAWLAVGLAAQHPAGSPRALPAAFADVAETHTPAVVSVTALVHPQSAVSGEGVSVRMGIDPLRPSGERADASGLLLSGDGEILTNYHVVADADTIEIGLIGEGRLRRRATYVGGDPLTDTAIVKLDNPPARLQTAALGDSQTVRPGDWVMAIGNPFQLGQTVTVGVVSFQGRPFEIVDGYWEDMIQTDVALNPGSSGGPLLNPNGEVIGINVAVLDAVDRSNTGIGFAIPINTVKAILPSLRKGDVTRGRLAAQFHGGPLLEDEARELGLPEPAGALVKSVDPWSVATRQQLRAGDVIVSIDRQSIRDTRDLLARTSTALPGTRVTAEIFRNGIRRTANLTIEAWPSERPARPSMASTADREGGLTLRSITAAFAARARLPAGMDGALVEAVATGSPADEGGAHLDDVIRAINGRAVHSVADVSRELHRLGIERPVFLLVWRNGTELLLEMRRR